MTELEKLEQRILEESRRFPEVSFAKLSRIAKHFYDFGQQERFVEPQGLEEAAEEYALKRKMSRKKNRWSVIFYEGNLWWCYNTPYIWRALFFALYHIGKVEEIRRLGK